MIECFSCVYVIPASYCTNEDDFWFLLLWGRALELILSKVISTSIYLMESIALQESDILRKISH